MRRQSDTMRDLLRSYIGWLGSTQQEKRGPVWRRMHLEKSEAPDPRSEAIPKFGFQNSEPVLILTREGY
jgi:hypothetical protein